MTKVSARVQADLYGGQFRHDTRIPTMTMTRTMFALMISGLVSFSPSARADNASYEAARKQASAMVESNKLLEGYRKLNRIKLERCLDAFMVPAVPPK